MWRYFRNSVLHARAWTKKDLNAQVSYGLLPHWAPRNGEDEIKWCEDSDVNIDFRTIVGPETTQPLPR